MGFVLGEKKIVSVCARKREKRREDRKNNSREEIVLNPQILLKTSIDQLLWFRIGNSIFFAVRDTKFTFRLFSFCFFRFILVKFVVHVVHFVQNFDFVIKQFSLYNRLSSWVFNVRLNQVIWFSFEFEIRLFELHSELQYIDIAIAKLPKFEFSNIQKSKYSFVRRQSQPAIFVSILIFETTMNPFR